MTEAFWPENFLLHTPSWLAGDAVEIPFNSRSGYTYWIEYADELGSNTVWTPFMNNYGMLEAIGSESVYTDDITTASSGSSPTNGHRFYRIWR